MSDMTELKEKLEEIAPLIKEFQTKNSELEAKGVKTSEELEAIGGTIEKMSDEFSELKTHLEAEEKAREALELALARKNEDQEEGSKSCPEYVKSFYSYLKTRKSIEPEQVDEEFKNLVNSTGAVISEDEMTTLKTLLVGSDPDGGFLVPVDMQSRIITRQFETSPMRGIADVITTGTEAVEFPLDDGEFGYENPAEVDTRNETDTSKIGVITIPTHNYEAMPVATQKMLDDAVFNIEQWVQRKISDKLTRSENADFVNGTGVKQALGFQTYADWTTLAQYERDALETRETATASTLAGDDLLDLQSDLLEYYQNNATWTMHRKVWVEVLKLKDSQNQYLMNPAMLFGGSLGLQLLGRPVVIFGDMPSSIADSAKVIAYGDWREGYTIVDRIGIRVLRDPYTSKGFVKFYTTKRTGGAVTNYQAIKRLKIQPVA